MCENTVSYYVPKGYFVWTNSKRENHEPKEVFGVCGQTGYDGQRLVCYDCSNDPRKMAEIERQEANIAADNAWARSAGRGEY